MKGKTMTSRLLLTTLAGLVALSHACRAEAVRIDTDTLKAKCQAWAAAYGTRRVDVAWTNLWKERQTQSFDSSAVPYEKGGCVTDQSNASFSVVRPGSVTKETYRYQVMLMPGGDGWVVASVLSNCGDLAYQGMLRSFQNGGYTLTDDLRNRIRTNVDTQVCPKQKDAVAAAIVKALSTP